MAEPAGRVVLRDASGVSYTVNPDEVDQAVAAGFRKETPEEAAQAALEEKYGGAAGATGAFAASAGRAATLGLSDLALTKSGIVKPETLGALEKVQPEWSTAGTVAGVGLPLLLSAGASAPLAAGEGALGAARTAASFSAPALISRAGQAVAKGVGAALPEASGTLGQIAAKALATGAGSAIEGGFYGAGEVAHEAALGDPNLTAQSALATIGLNAALGGGLGALAGAGEVVVPAAVGKARESLGNLFQEGMEGLKSVAAKTAEAGGTAQPVASLMLEHAQEISALERATPGIAEQMSQATPEMAQWMLKNGDRLAEMQAAFPNVKGQLARTSPETADFLLDNWQRVVTDPKKRMAVAGEMRKGLQEVLDSTEGVLKRVNTELAPREAEALLQTADAGAVKAGFEGSVAKMDEAIAAMRAEPELHSPAMTRHVEKLREGLIRDGADRLSPVDAFQRMKVLRQTLDDAIPYGKDAMAMSFAERNSAKVLKELRGSVKKTLTDEGVFGAAASRQAGLDDAISTWRKLTGKGGPFKKAFLDTTGRIPSTKVDTWLNALAKDKGVESAEAMGQLIAAAKKVVSEADASFRSAPVGAFDRAAADGLIDKTASMAAEAKKSGEATAMMKYLDSGGVGIPNSGPFVPNPAMRMAGKAAEMVLPGMVTSTIKATLNVGQTLKSAPKMVAVLANLERAAQSISRHIDTAAATLAHGSVKAANIGRSEAAAGIASVFGKTAEENSALYLKRSTHLRELSGNVDKLYDTLSQQTDGMHEHAPNTAQAAQAASARGVAFLASKIPQPPDRGPLAPKWRPSQAEISKFNRYYQAVEDPTSILKQAAAGTLTPESVEAVKAVYPDLFQKMTTSILDKLTSQRTPVPYRTKLMVSFLLGTDLDGTLSPASIARNQAAIRGPSAKAPDSLPGNQPSAKGSEKLTIATRSQLPSRRLAAGVEP